MRISLSRLCWLPVLAAAACTLGVLPAQGAARADMHVKRGEPATASYPPLLGVAPTSGTVDLDPPTCARPEVAFCDTVAIDVQAAGDLTTDVSWSDLDGGTDDIDILLYERRPSGEYAKLRTSESANRPESITLKVPAGPLYLVVVHFAGANDGYTVTSALAAPGATAPENVAGAARPAPSVRPPSAEPAPAPPRRSGTPAPFANRAAPSVRTPQARPLPGAPASAFDVEADARPAASGGSAAASGPVDRGRDLGNWAWLATAVFPVALAAIVLRVRATPPGAVS